MPLCTTCTHPTPFLYTVYQSAYNLRLEKCVACNNFADPYVEHDSLTLLLDLILLKRSVYRHLLYNRGAEPKKVGIIEEEKEKSPTPIRKGEKNEKLKEKLRWFLILRLGSALVLVDAFIRWTHMNPRWEDDVTPWPRETIEAFLRIFVGCLVETMAFHVGIMLSCYLTLILLDKSRSSTTTSGIRQEFRFTLIPLSLLYSSMSKLFLLFLLSIWRPSSKQASTDQEPSIATTNVIILTALDILDDDKLDREWIIRNVLGGMSAGFGLRVILDWHPVFTTVIILAGWVVKTLVASLVSGWVGGDEVTGEAWLAYSIP